MFEHSAGRQHFFDSTPPQQLVRGFLTISVLQQHSKRMGPCRPRLCFVEPNEKQRLQAALIGSVTKGLNGGVIVVERPRRCSVLETFEHELVETRRLKGGRFHHLLIGQLLIGQRQFVLSE